MPANYVPLKKIKLPEPALSDFGYVLLAGVGPWPFLTQESRMSDV